MERERNETGWSCGQELKLAAVRATTAFSAGGTKRAKSETSKGEREGDFLTDYPFLRSLAHGCVMVNGVADGGMKLAWNGHC